jgi:hypothetical protein
MVMELANSALLSLMAQHSITGPATGMFLIEMARCAALYFR